MNLDDEIDKLLSTTTNPTSEPKLNKIGAEWQAGVIWNGNEGTITTNALPLEEAPNWDAILRIWGLDPENFRVIEPVLFNVWGNPDGALNRQWKGKVVQVKDSGSKEEFNELWTGDSIEGCVGHYAQQTFSVELDRRDQVKVARRLLRDALIRWSKYFVEVQVMAVAGNHGENRNSSGKSYTTLNDNDDVAIVEQVAEILETNPEAFGHIQFAIPKDRLSITAEVAGWVLGITHGHAARRGGQGSEQKLRRWLEGQSLGRQNVGGADVLVSGHFHHFRAADWGGCMWLQAPAMDGGSDWWREITGEKSESGVLTFCMYPEIRVTDIAILK